MLFRIALLRLPKSSTIFLSSSFSPSVFFCSTPYQFQSFLPDLLFSAVNVALVVFVVKCSHSRIHIPQMRLQIGDLCYPWQKISFALPLLFLLKRLFVSYFISNEKALPFKRADMSSFGSMSTVCTSIHNSSLLLFDLIASHR